MGLWYPRESPFDLEAFSDSDYGGSNLDRKSTTGGCQFLGQRLISWQCKKQTIVATSTTEAEYVAAANCCGQVLWVQNQLLDYGFNFMNTKIHIDNESTICIVKNPVYHSKTKHIEIRHHFIRDCYEKKLISVEKIHTDLNVADLLTKPFDGPRFNYLVVSIGIAWMKGRSAKCKRRKESKGKKVATSMDFQEEVNTGSIKVSTVSEQEEASLAEAIRLDTLQKEEEAKQVHLDSLLAQRLAEEEELNEQQKKRRAQVQFEAQHYTDEDWDLIRAKIEANAELSKSMLGSDLQGEDFAKKMVDLVNQRKKYFAEERARAKRNKPMTQSQLRTYMMNYLKNQGTWKLSQLKNLSFDEVKEEFDKLVKQVESFAPINFEATKDSLKRFGEELQTKTSKRLKSDEAKDDEPTKKSGKRRKQMARKGLHTDLDKDDSEDSDEASEQDDSVSGVYQIIKEDGTDYSYINFGAMLKDISRDDLTELYRIVMNRYGMDGLEDELEKVCKAMLDKKLQGGKPDEDCYKMLKMMEKQAGIRKTEGKLAHLELPLISLPYPEASQAARDAYNALYDAQNEVACLMLGSMSTKLQRALENYKAYDMIQ
ncbi:hypothetical protein Tco_0569428 [Tanacetum coccineum]